jgi:putative membrane protein
MSYPGMMPGSGRRLQPGRLKRGESMHGWNGDGHMGWMGIWWILGAAVLPVVVWALLKSARRPTAGRGESPEDIVERRYANGEIDQEIYQRMLTDLKGSAGMLL